ncbi:hypothetical protein H072_2609 [Dactylellina haptotyla CBS 200.50]|uniref:Uncharacterized protein n=1 Tax=Dactylellina haptotyla (strain CBS 200.50) TaxID=1284197 RepID=S8AQS5_DACHA|nr:hypothetical protein H072_2609 [Dactylellina haptotyla CBS 200.50]
MSTKDHDMFSNVWGHTSIHDYPAYSIIENTPQDECALKLANLILSTDDDAVIATKLQQIWDSILRYSMVSLMSILAIRGIITSFRNGKANTSPEIKYHGRPLNWQTLPDFDKRYIHWLLSASDCQGDLSAILEDDRMYHDSWLSYITTGMQFSEDAINDEKAHKEDASYEPPGDLKRCGVLVFRALEDREFPGVYWNLAMYLWARFGAAEMWKLAQENKEYDDEACRAGKLFSKDWKGYSEERWHVWEELLEAQLARVKVWESTNCDYPGDSENYLNVKRALAFMQSARGQVN